MKKNIFKKSGIIKRKSLGKRVMLYVLSLGVMSTLGICLNDNAIKDIGKRSDFYGPYIELKSLDKEIDLAYVEVCAYANSLASNPNDENIEKFNTSITLLDEKKNELRDYSKDIISVIDYEKDTELISTINAWLDSTNEFESEAISSAKAIAKGDNKGLLEFIEKIPSYKEETSNFDEVYESLLAERLSKVKSKSSAKISGTNKFNLIVLIINCLAISAVVIVLYKKLV